MQIRKCLIFGAALLAVAMPSVNGAFAANLSGAEVTCPQSVAGGESVEFFKAGVKFDPETHQWKDRYNGKVMDLGLPGVNERFANNTLISAVTATNGAPGGSANATTGATASTTNTFPWKKVITYTIIGCGIATAIAVPIACGVSAHHHQHHLQNNRQANQAALYYYYHNQTIAPPVFQAPPPVFIRRGPPKPPPKQPLFF